MILKKYKSTATIYVSLPRLLIHKFLCVCLVFGIFCNSRFNFSKLVSQQEIVSLYERFCQLDRSAKGFISADEFLSVPEFAMNPLSQVAVGLISKLINRVLVAEFGFYLLFFVGFWGCSEHVWSFDCLGSLQRLLKMVDGLNFKDFVSFLSAFSAKASIAQKIECMSFYAFFSLLSFWYLTCFYLFNCKWISTIVEV